MNREAIAEVRDRILAHAERFEMRTWVGVRTDVNEPDFCNTVACIAGHACLMAGKVRWSVYTFERQPTLTLSGSGEWVSTAAEILGLDRGEGIALFIGSWPARFLPDYTYTGVDLNGPEGAKYAAAMLDAILDGSVVWDDDRREWVDLLERDVIDDDFPPAA